MEISDDEIKVLFDISTHSLDFGSGFLDCEEVQVLQSVAKYLGAPLREATPYNHRKDSFYQAECKCSQNIEEELKKTN